MFSLILAFGFVSYVEDIKCKVVQYAGPHISGDKFIYFFPNHQPEGCSVFNYFNLCNRQRRVYRTISISSIFVNSLSSISLLILKTRSRTGLLIWWVV